MKVSLSWLKYYVDIDVTAQELCDKMVMAGFEVEEMIDLASTMTNVVVAKVLKMEKHPDSDHLWICQMDIGKDEPVQIVTGAQNVNEGDLVPAALHDSHLPNGMHIKNGKLRGVVSNGMLCSGGELLLTESDYEGAEVNGILILKPDCATPGTDMRDILGLNDYIIDFKITANRPDCQSVLGIAREVGAVLKKEMKTPAISYKTVGGDISEHISVEVKNYDLCPRYYGRVVKNVRIAESPDWMKRCITAAGMRPINNIVDITNFVMLETGQPMHAFNLSAVRDAKIIVRNATENESITTLDGKEYKLSPEMLVIADGEAPSCLAGIMGGRESEIEADTKDIFFECAKFRRDSVRKTSRKLGIRTESSGRFERGVDITTVEYAMERALQLVYDLNAGDIVDGIIDRNEGLPAPRPVSVTVDSVNELLGLTIDGETMKDILNSLEIPTTLENGTLNCLVPSFRDDIEGRADIAEEVMRIYGYDHIIGTRMNGTVLRGKKSEKRLKDDKVKETLLSAGVSEIYTYSFIGSKAIDALDLNENDDRRNAVTILNPLGDEYSVMRTQLATSMLTVLGTNYARKNSAVRFFELSKVFIPKEMPIVNQPEEKPALCIGMYGQEEDFFTLKGIVEAVVSQFASRVTFGRATETYLHPGRAAVCLANNVQVAVFGEVHPDTAAKFGIDGRCYLAEIDLSALYSLASRRIIFKPLPKFPAVKRDLAVVCEESVTVGELENAISSGAGRLLEKVELFDIYRSEALGENKKSVAFAITLRAEDRTLNEAETDEIMKKVISKLEKAGAALRS